MSQYVPAGYLGCIIGIIVDCITSDWEKSVMSKGMRSDNCLLTGQGVEKALAKTNPAINNEESEQGKILERNPEDRRYYCTSECKASRQEE
jgi:hypothetical protein